MNPFKYPGTDNHQKAPEQKHPLAEAADLRQQYAQVVDLSVQKLAQSLQYYPRPVASPSQPAPEVEAVTAARGSEWAALNPLLAAAREAVGRAFEPSAEGVNQDVQEAA